MRPDFFALCFNRCGTIVSQSKMFQEESGARGEYKLFPYAIVDRNEGGRRGLDGEPLPGAAVDTPSHTSTPTRAPRMTGRTGLALASTSVARPASRWRHCRPLRPFCSPVRGPAANEQYGKQGLGRNQYRTVAGSEAC